MRFILALGLSALSCMAHAEDVVRRFTDLEPIAPALERISPAFETGVLRVDMPASQVMDRLKAEGFTLTLRHWSKRGAGVDGRYFLTEAYDQEIAALKESDEKSSKETVRVTFLPGQGGVSALTRRVEFQYRVWQPRLTQQQVETALTNKFGGPVLRVEQRQNKTSENAHILGLYCFDGQRAAMLSAEKCGIEQARKDGYSYDIEINQDGEVVAFQVTYDASSYAESYDAAVHDRMDALLRENPNLGVSVAPPLEP